jgi:uncharacterized membrane protein YfcA
MNFYVVLILVALLIGLSKGGLGAVLGVLVVPMLTLVMPTQSAVSLALPLLMVGDVFGLHSYWKTWDMRHVRLLLPTAIVGIVIGTWLLKNLDSLTLRHILGLFTLLFVVYKIADYRLKSLDYHPHAWHGVVAGLFSGLGSALANAGSVPFTAYMLLQGVTPTIFAGTTTIFFAILNALRVPVFLSEGLLHPDDLLGILWVTPIIPIGVYTGRWLINRINKQSFEYVMLIILVIASAVLLFSN